LSYFFFFIFMSRVLYYTSGKIKFFSEDHLIVLLIGLELHYIFQNNSLVRKLSFLPEVSNLFIEQYTTSTRYYDKFECTGPLVYLFIMPFFVLQFFFDSFLDSLKYPLKVIEYSIKELMVLDKNRLRVFLVKNTTLISENCLEKHGKIKDHNLHLYNLNRLSKLNYLEQINTSILFPSNTSIPRIIKFANVNIDYAFSEISSFFLKVLMTPPPLMRTRVYRDSYWCSITQHKNKGYKKSLILNFESFNFLSACISHLYTHTCLVNFNFKKNNNSLYFFLWGLTSCSQPFLHFSYERLRVENVIFYQTSLLNPTVEKLRYGLFTQPKLEVFYSNFYSYYFNLEKSIIVDKPSFYKTWNRSSKFYQPKLNYIKYYFILDLPRSDSYDFNQYKTPKKGNFFSFSSIKLKVPPFYFNCKNSNTPQYYLSQVPDWLHWYNLDVKYISWAENILNDISYKNLFFNNFIFSSDSRSWFFFKKKSILTTAIVNPKQQKIEFLFYSNDKLPSILMVLSKNSQCSEKSSLFL